MGFFFLKLNAFYKCKEEDANTVDCFLVVSHTFSLQTVSSLAMRDAVDSVVKCNNLPSL